MSILFNLLHAKYKPYKTGTAHIHIINHIHIVYNAIFAIDDENILKHELNERINERKKKNDVLAFTKSTNNNKRKERRHIKKKFHSVVNRAQSTDRAQNEKKKKVNTNMVHKS